MLCGAKCFTVLFEQDGKQKEKRIIARTPAKARRLARKNLNSNIEIISVRREK